MNKYIFIPEQHLFNFEHQNFLSFYCSTYINQDMGELNRPLYNYITIICDTVFCTTMDLFGFYCHDRFYIAK